MFSKSIIRQAIKSIIGWDYYVGVRPTKNEASCYDIQVFTPNKKYGAYCVALRDELESYDNISTISRMMARSLTEHAVRARY